MKKTLKSSSVQARKGGSVDPKAYEGTLVGVLAGSDPAGRPPKGTARGSSTAALPPRPGDARRAINAPWTDGGKLRERMVTDRTPGEDEDDDEYPV